MNYLPSPQILFFIVLVAANFIFLLSWLLQILFFIVLVAANFLWYTAIHFLMISLSMEKHGNLFMSTNRVYSKNFNCLLSVCYKNNFKGPKFNYYQLEINV